MAEKYKLKNGNILKNGHTMFLEDVVTDLERKSYLEDKLKGEHDPYKILITNIPDFRSELMKMIEQVKYQIGEYHEGSSSQIAEKFEHKINSLVKHYTGHKETPIKSLDDLATKIRRDHIFNTLLEMITDEHGIHEDLIQFHSHLKNDLYMDSLDVVKFGMEIEKEYGIIISDEMSDKFHDNTLDYVVDSIIKTKDLCGK